MEQGQVGNQAQPNLTQWKSHKIVVGGKISMICGTTLTVEDATGAAITISPGAGYFMKHDPKVGGYYVLYGDGYESWSPAEAFEGGYTPVPDNISILFASFNLNEQGAKKMSFIASAFQELLSQLYSVCPDGREFSIVKTKLEEACMFAKKSVAIHPENRP